MNCIGFFGHRGCGKDTWAFLIGKTLEWMKDNKYTPGERWNMTENYLNEYVSWINEINTDENFIKHQKLKSIYFASFSDSLKSIISLFTGCDYEQLTSASIKDNIFINIYSFKIQEDIIENIITPEQLFELRNKNLSLEYCNTDPMPDAWMKLEDFIIYFGYFICRNYLGKDIWTRVQQIDDIKYPSDCEYKIYSDIKTMSEYKYIKDKNGFIIKINTPIRFKKNILVIDEKLKKCNDYNILINCKTSQLLDIIDDVWDTAVKINEYYK